MLKKKVLLILPTFSFILYSFQLYAFSNNPQSIIQEISEINMRTLPWQEKDWEEKEYHVFLKEAVNRRVNPTERFKRSTAFSFFEKSFKHQKIIPPSVIKDNTTLHDLNMFCGQSDKQKYLANIINVRSQLGKMVSFFRLATPTANTKELLQRQAIPQLLLQDPQLLADILHILQSFPESENVFLSFWRQDNFVHASKNYYFSLPFLDILNTSKPALLAKSVINHQRRIGWAITDLVAAVVLTSYGIVRATNMVNVPEKIKTWAEQYSNPAGPIFSLLESVTKKIPKSITKPVKKIFKNRYLSASICLSSGILSALGIKSQLNWIYCCLLIEECIQKLMIKIAHFTHCMEQLYQKIKQHPTLTRVKEFKGLIDFFEIKTKQDKKLKELLELLHYDTFQANSSFLAHKGTILRAYALMHKLKKQFEAAALSIGSIDMYTAVARMYKEHKDTSTPYCFPIYAATNTPCIKIKGFWHPLINPDELVKNDITIGCDTERQNMIITGPNAGGKSTTLKSIATSLVMAQSFGIAPAQHMLFTPFDLIATYLNITDDIGVGNSLFKSEVIRTENLISAIESLKQNQFSFVMFDEVFNGTTPQEGAASAYSVAQYLSKIPNNICLIATHFIMLTELADATDTFANYKVSVNKKGPGQIEFLYRLSKGISDQHVAIDILQGEGFNSEILQNAQDIIQREFDNSNLKKCL